MAEGLRRGDRAEATDLVAVAADMWAEAAMHWDAAHLRVAHFAGVVAGDVGDQPRREHAHIAEPALAEQDLIERRHAARGRVAAAARHSSRLEFRRVVARLGRV